MEAVCKHGFKFNECLTCKRLIEFNLEHPFVPSEVRQALQKILEDEIEDDKVVKTVKALGGEVR